MTSFRRRLTSLLILAALPLASAHGASAATEAEWQAFREDVRSKCAVAAEPLFETMEIFVDPFGSQSYGLALIRGKARGADVTISSICVYDKQAQTVEIGGELADEPMIADMANEDGPGQ